MCHSHIRACQNPNACGNYILRVEITLMRVVFTFVPVEITLRVEITLCV
jgi:hypothetical protein